MTSQSEVGAPMELFGEEKWSQIKNKPLIDIDILVVSSYLAESTASTPFKIGECLGLEKSAMNEALNESTNGLETRTKLHRILAKWRDLCTEKPTWCLLLQRLCRLTLTLQTTNDIKAYVLDHYAPTLHEDTKCIFGTPQQESQPNSFLSFQESVGDKPEPFSDPITFPEADVIEPVQETSMALYAELVTGLAQAPIFDAQLNDSIALVAKNVKVLLRKFAHITCKAYDELIKNEVSLAKLRIFTTSLSVHESEYIPLYDQKMAEIITRTSIEEVMILLTRMGAWDFLNFGILEDIAIEFKATEVQALLSDYTVEVTEFKKETKLVDFLSVWSGRIPKDHLPNCEPVMAMLSEEWKDFTLHKVSEVEHYLANEFKLRQHVFRLSNAKKACVTLMWMLPKSAVLKMKATISKVSRRNLSSFKIEQLIIGGTVYKVGLSDYYSTLYKKSLVNQEGFWRSKALEYLQWIKKFDKVLAYDEQKAVIKWFLGGKLNVSVNCLDRHVVMNPDRIAIIWEKDEGNHEEITYKKLLDDTCQIANVLKKKGVQKGDRVIIYMPAMPLLIASMMACARIGAVHCVMFTNFGKTCLSLCIKDTGAKVIITADGRFVGGKWLPLKENVNAAIKKDKMVVDAVLVASRKGDITLTNAWECLLEEEMKKEPTECDPVPMDSDDDLFIICTSGTSSKPKGIVHTQAGYLLYASFTLKFTFDYKQGDIFGCVADPGWILGHSYVVYGPLCLGGTTLLFESTATYPNNCRYWEMIQRLKITHFNTTPSVLQKLMKEDDMKVKNYDLSSLKTFASVGEPLKEEVQKWCSEIAQCCVLDTWWQTELGGTAIIRWWAVDPEKKGLPPYYPAAKSFQFFGVDPYLVKEEKQGDVKLGHLYLKKLLPGMGRRINQIGQQDYKDYYFPNGDYCTHDKAMREQDCYQVIGRVDDAVRIQGVWADIPKIESAIDNSNDGIAESVVVGGTQGEELVAFVQPKNWKLGESDKELLVEKAKVAVQEKLGPNAVPKQFAFAEYLPRTLSGKNIRATLRLFLKSFPIIGDCQRLPDIDESVMKSFENQRRRMYAVTSSLSTYSPSWNKKQLQVPIPV